MQDQRWWDEYFSDQETILKKFQQGDCSFKIQPFHWPDHQSTVRMIPSKSNAEVHALINSPEREMYVGGYRSRQRQEEMAEMWSGSINDIKVGTMVVTLAENDPHGHMFWVAKVIDICRCDNNEIESIKVHWFRTKHCDAYKGRYIPEFVPHGSTKRKRSGAKNCPNTSVLDLQEVDILVFDFTMTSTGHLRKRTIDIIKQRLPTKVNNEVGTSSRKTRAQMEAQLGLHRDEDNVIVDSLEEDGSSTSSPSDENMRASSEFCGVETDEDCMD